MLSVSNSDGISLIAARFLTTVAVVVMLSSCPPASCGSFDASVCCTYCPCDLPHPPTARPSVNLSAHTSAYALQANHDHRPLSAGMRKLSFGRAFLAWPNSFFASTLNEKKGGMLIVTVVFMRLLPFLTSWRLLRICSRPQNTDIAAGRGSDSLSP
jgi:hypothetical protein